MLAYISIGIALCSIAVCLIFGLTWAYLYADIRHSSLLQEEFRTTVRRLIGSICLQYRWPSIYLEQWQADVETFERSDHFTALRAFRNVGLAHRNDPNVPDPRSKSNTRRVMCGDARIVLEGTIPIVHRLNSLIKGVIHSPDFDRKRQG
jgi:hypothetical protein